MLPSPEEVERLRRLARQPDFGDARYAVTRELAHGGMGTVYLAEDTQLGRPVAIKVVHPGDEPRRLLAEARTLARLEHPGIVPVHDAGELADGRWYFVMKYVEGERLDEYAAKATLRARLRVFARVVEAVEFAHARGIPHRDLKPENVMVGRYGEVAVLDWGQPGAGTPGWMAPEHAGDGAGSRSGDVYALGLMLGRLTEGFGEPALAAIAAKAAEVDPARRYGSAGALREEVNRYLDLDRVEAFREPWWESGRRLARRHRVALILVLTYVIVRFLLIYFGGR